MFLTSTPLGPVIRITYERVLECRGRAPRRIDFARTRPDQPKRSTDPRWVGSFSVPFDKTIKPLFKAATGFDFIHKTSVFHGKEMENYFLSIKTEDDFTRIQNWVAAQGTLVFLRDCLDLSLALDSNFVEVGGPYTTLGELEHKAKASQDADALETLGDLLINAIRDLPFYKDTKMVMAVPAAKEKLFDLPSVLAQRVAFTLSKEDLTSRFAFHGAKGQVKDCALEEEWLQLESADLRYTGSNLAGACVILIDDKYQSGTTMQYVAMKLQEAGAKRVYGISLVKTLRDGDNVATK